MTETYDVDLEIDGLGLLGAEWRVDGCKIEGLWIRRRRSGWVRAHKITRVL